LLPRLFLPGANRDPDDSKQLATGFLRWGRAYCCNPH
jgi:hypothetical protein